MPRQPNKVTTTNTTEEGGKTGEEAKQLDSLTIKSLLQDIEVSGKPRRKFNLRLLCDERPRLYGSPGRKGKDSLRRRVQKKFDQIQRKDPEKYLKYLSNFGVLPGEVCWAVHLFLLCHGLILTCFVLL
jgi:hypothetical protein